MTQGAETGSSAYLLIEGSAAMSGLFSTGILTIDNGGTLAAGGALQFEEDAALTTAPSRCRTSMS